MHSLNNDRYIISTNMKRILPFIMLMMTAPLAARADITSRMLSSIQLQTNAAATQVSRIGSTYSVSGSGVTMDVGGGGTADNKVGGLGTLTDGVGQGSIATAATTTAGGAFTFSPVSYTHLTLPTIYSV